MAELKFVEGLFVLAVLLSKCFGQSPASVNPPNPEIFTVSTLDVPVRDVAPDFTFAVWDSNGKICILAKFSATFQITYTSTGGEKMVSVNLPDDARAKGHCGTSDREPMLELKWPGFVLMLIFTAVNPSKQDSWELLSMEILYNTAKPIFDEATNAGKKAARSLQDGLFATQYGKSYFCPSPDLITLYKAHEDRVVLAHLKDVHIQVYDIHGGKFSPSQQCSLVRIGAFPNHSPRTRPSLLQWEALWLLFLCSL